jgi:TetR/AcrR family transcriptional regulator, cholesterol catabolism regulator
MTRELEVRTPAVADRIVAESIALFEVGGPDAVAVREVARRARVSLRDIYRLFGSRDDLIIVGVGEWMQQHMYASLERVSADTPPFDALIEQFRRMFEPWERNPRALETFVYALSTANGDILVRRGESVVGPINAELFADVDRDLADDLWLIITNVVYAQMAQVAAGHRSIDELVPTIERVIRRLARCT